MKVSQALYYQYLPSMYKPAMEILKLTMSFDSTSESTAVGHAEGGGWHT